MSKHAEFLRNRLAQKEASADTTRAIAALVESASEAGEINPEVAKALSSLVSDDDDDALVDVKYISRLGGWAQRTTWRYLEIGYLGFPQPVIRNKPMVRWRKRDVLDWFRSLGTPDQGETRAAS
jgi:predicted DNA-binding transcriptional regulator AlpA